VLFFKVIKCSFNARNAFRQIYISKWEYQRGGLGKSPQSNHSKVEAISLSALPKDTTSEIASLSSQYPFLMLNVKEEVINTNF